MSELFVFEMLPFTRVWSRWKLKGCHSTEMRHTDPKVGGGYVSGFTRQALGRDDSTFSFVRGGLSAVDGH